MKADKEARLITALHLQDVFMGQIQGEKAGHRWAPLLLEAIYCIETWRFPEHFQTTTAPPIFTELLQVGSLPRVCQRAQKLVGAVHHPDML